jgi:hypothetical protein
MYVKLPAAPAARSACLRLYLDTCRDWRVQPDAAFMADQQQRYLVLPLPK